MLTDEQIEALAAALHHTVCHNDCELIDADDRADARNHIAPAVEAIVAAHVTAAKAAMWDEVAQALAWATENGSAPVRYVIDNNPYRATP